MRMLAAVLLACLLVGTSLAMWTESVDIYTLDVKGRPLKNAEVLVTYQSYACDRHELIARITDESGAAHVDMTNIVPEEAVTSKCVERQYNIHASYMGAASEMVGVVGRQAAYYVTLPVAEYRINAKSASGRSLYPFIISIDGQETVNPISTFATELPLGRGVVVNITYGEISLSQSVNLTGDYYKDVILSVYDLHIQLFNESGDRVKGQIKVGNLSEWSLLTEDAVFEKFPYRTANFTVIINDKERVMEQRVNSGNLSLSIDNTNPSIKDVTQTASAGNVKISAYVSDEGAYSSGLASNPIIRYVFNDSVNWSVVKMYPKTAKVFEGDIPADGRDVVYQIVAIDRQNNEEIYDGRYEFKPVKPSGGRVPSIGEIFSGIFSNLSLPHIIGIVVFIFIIILVYRKVREIV